MNKSERLDARYALAFRADYSSRYHRRRSSFLMKLDTFFNLIILIAGTGAFVSLTTSGPEYFAQAAALTVATLTVLQVVLRIGPSGAAHAEWMRRWDRLANEIRANNNPTEEDLNRWETDRATIEGECVSELEALAVDCENDARGYIGETEGLRKVGFWQKAFIQLGTFQTHFPPIEPSEVAKEPKRTEEG